MRMASSRRRVPMPSAVGRVLRALKADGHMALGAQVVDLVGLHFLNDADQVGGVGQVAVVQHEASVVDMRVLVEVVDPVGVEQAGAALDAVHLVAFFEQQLGQVGAVLAGHAGDQCCFHWGGQDRLVSQAPRITCNPGSTRSALPRFWLRCVKHWHLARQGHEVGVKAKKGSGLTFHLGR